MNQRIAAVHDLSGYGRASLTIVSPILSSMGIQVCPLPTALLSTHTGGFKDYYFVDLTEHLTPIIEHWKKEKIRFDGIYTGFLGSCLQADIISRFIQDFRNPGSLVVVDPVMGDHGKLYGPFDMKMVEAMKELVDHADVITPNATEAAFLLDISKNDIETTAKEWMTRLKALAQMGPRYVIITSVSDKDFPSKISVMAYDKKFNQYWKADTEWLPVSYPGTGDMFASVITGSLMQGDSLPIAMDRAVSFVLHAMRSTYSLDLPARDGVLLEKALPLLNQSMQCMTREIF